MTQKRWITENMNLRAALARAEERCAESALETLTAQQYAAEQVIRAEDAEAKVEMWHRSYEEALRLRNAAEERCARLREALERIQRVAAKQEGLEPSVSFLRSNLGRIKEDARRALVADEGGER